MTFFQVSGRLESKIQ